jgi:hypothetical protein
MYSRNTIIRLANTLLYITKVDLEQGQSSGEEFAVPTFATVARGMSHLCNVFHELCLIAGYEDWWPSEQKLALRKLSGARLEHPRRVRKRRR